jgi:hypothetical protein
MDLELESFKHIDLRAYAAGQAMSLIVKKAGRGLP